MSQDFAHVRITSHFSGRECSQGTIVILTLASSSNASRMFSLFQRSINQLKCTHQDDLVPHSSVLLLFITSAQTHIFPEIRIDAVRFLDIVMDVMPGSV